jgi:nucleoside-specific outer membrane channel protein Tsx
MFSRILKVGLLTGCLVVAGQASAADRNVVVPVLAGAAVGAVLVAVLANASDDDDRRHAPRRYHQPPRHQAHYSPRSRRAGKYRPKRVEYVRVERRDWRGRHR